MFIKTKYCARFDQQNIVGLKLCEIQIYAHLVIIIVND